ncbi:5'-methylthioadenosine/S-adenosylhomocysteine nucleosidase [Motilimonas pumila]|uniref:5'-methylthioadenosine/S-adenosylhomocysteine nucleosidase n=1 Tax=Motilimonas pumila TaxID=2303987 RepID=A0A418YC75_9GAMM|nr:5'-methylthioadenosine/S-adenosylhomocysteine nucleosidase [Motilimonas pumila]RJG42093.1 5'-methylthioadenosine/S-adenosylhomocysteine nucleosidase [Motilimonas pumila]
MKIGIIGAMEQEVAILREQLTDVDTLAIAGCEFYAGKLHGVEVVLTKSGIGKVAASVATTLLLERYQPDVIINTGSAGGYDQALQVGDVVISSEVRHHDVDLTVFGYEMGQCAQQPAAFIPASNLVDVAKQSIAAMSDAVKVVEGLICTGDSFMADPAKVEYARTNFPTMAAVEMEAAAIAQVCHQFSVPFVVIRSLSDIAGKESGQSFEEYLVVAAKHSSEMVANMVQRLT